MIISWFSCGAASAVATYLTLKNCKDDVLIYYIDTGSEHRDNLRFVEDCRKWFNHDIITRRSDVFSNVFDVIRKCRYINGSAGARCTLELKKRVRYAIEDELQNINGQVFGFTSEESKRALRFKEQNPKTLPIFPLIDYNLSKADCLAILVQNKIAVPKMYTLGFTNNNCIGCVKGGRGYWARIRKYFPEQFKTMASIERELGHSCINGCFLDELPKDYPLNSEIMPECSLFCEPEFLNL